MPDSIFARNWIKLIERLKSLDKRLVTELDACSHELQTLLKTQRDATHSISDLRPGSNLSEFKVIRLQLSNSLLRDAATYLEKRRPHEKAITAFETFDRNIETLIRSFLETVQLSGSDALEAIESMGLTTWLASLCKLRRKEFALFELSAA